MLSRLHKNLCIESDDSGWLFNRCKRRWSKSRLSLAANYLNLKGKLQIASTHNLVIISRYEQMISLSLTHYNNCELIGEETGQNLEPL